MALNNFLMFLNPFLISRTVKSKCCFKGLFVVTFQKTKFYMPAKTKENGHQFSKFQNKILKGGSHLCAVVIHIFQLRLCPDNSRSRRIPK